MTITSERRKKEFAVWEMKVRRDSEILHLQIEIDQLIDRRVRQNKTLKGDQIPRKAVEEMKRLLVQKWIGYVYSWEDLQ